MVDRPLIPKQSEIDLVAVIGGPGGQERRRPLGEGEAESSRMHIRRTESVESVGLVAPKPTADSPRHCAEDVIDPSAIGGAKHRPPHKYRNPYPSGLDRRLHCQGDRVPIVQFNPHISQIREAMEGTSANLPCRTELGLSATGRHAIAERTDSGYLDPHPVARLEELAGSRPDA